MKIFIHNIQLYARHGVLPQERHVGAQFRVSIEAETHQEQSTETDQLDDTVNYADMVQVVQEEMAVPSQLLEHVAGRIGRRLLKDFPTLTQVCVRLTKENPPIPGLQCDGAGVELTLNNPSTRSI